MFKKLFDRKTNTPVRKSADELRDTMDEKLAEYEIRRCGLRPFEKPIDEQRRAEFESLEVDTSGIIVEEIEAVGYQENISYLDNLIKDKKTSERSTTGREDAIFKRGLE